MQSQAALAFLDLFSCVPVICITYMVASLVFSRGIFCIRELDLNRIVMMNHGVTEKK